MKLCLLCGLLVMAEMFCPNVIAAESLKEIQKQVHSVSDVVTWLEQHLRYKNINEWDPAPQLDSVIQDGYGDCKMLAGVASELLHGIGVANWIITIKQKDYYHMFVVFRDDADALRIFNNARLLPQSFTSWDDILAHFSVTKMINRHTNYAAFQKWFNRIYRDILHRSVNLSGRKAI